MRFLLIFLLIPFALSSQTIELEKSFINELVKNQKMDKYKSRELTKAWSKLLENFGEYPDLPINEKTKKVEFIKVANFPNKNQKEIYQLVKEWISINYGSIDAVLHYENMERGKVIVKGRFKMEVSKKYQTPWFSNQTYETKMDAYHTAIFTAKDKKLKIEFTNISYEYYTGGYKVGSYYQPLEQRNFYISDLYPITDSEKELWNYRFFVLQKTTNEIKSTMTMIENYIIESDTRNNF